MRSFIVLFTLIHFSSTFTVSQPRQSAAVNELKTLISAEHCQFYASLNTHFQCGSKSHLIHYSQKYCLRLLDIRQSFDNTKYQDDVRQCLQEKLFDRIQKAAEGAVTCDTVKQIDLDSHKNCLPVSFKSLSTKDVKQFIATFKDTTVNYAQLCRLANSFAGHYSQAFQSDVMVFIKKQLKEVFAEGDTSSCIIKEKDLIDEISEIVEQVESVLNKVKKVKDDIIVIIEKSKAIHDDFKSIRQTINEMKNGTITTNNGLKEILDKSKTIAANSKVIIEIIKNLGQDKTNTNEGQQGNEKDLLVLNQISQIIGQLDVLKEKIYNVADNGRSIVDIVDEIRDGKTNVADGLANIIDQIEQGVDNIYSILETAYSIKDTVLIWLNH